MARDFDGSTGYLGASASPITGPPVTMFCWFNPDVVNTVMVPFSLAQDGSPYRALYLLLSNASPQPEVYDGTNVDSLVIATTITAGTWNSMALVVSSNTSRVAYCNGVSKTGTSTSIGLTGLDRVRVGDLTGAGFEYFHWNGKVAEPAVWDAALTADEIASLERGVSPLLVRPQSLVGYWPVYGRHSPEIDIVGGVGLTVSGTAPAAEHPRIFLPRRRLILTVPSAPTAYTLTADSGSFTLTGAAASLERGYRLDAASGSFTLTGTAASLERGYPLAAATGTFALAGADATLRVTRRLDAAAGALSLTGTAASLEVGYVLAAASGSLTLTGTDADLVYDGAGGAYVLTADAGAVDLTGTAAGLVAARRVDAAAGAVSLAGTAAGLLATRRLDAAGGSLALTGTAAALEVGYTLPAAGGTLALTGTAATLRVARRLPADAAILALTGSPAGLLRSLVAVALSGSFDVAGPAVGLLRGRRLSALAGAYLLTGNDATLRRSNAVDGPFVVEAWQAFAAGAVAGDAAGAGAEAGHVYRAGPEAGRVSTP